MKKIILFSAILCMTIGCCTTKHLPPKETTIVHHIDSIAWHDSTIYHNIYHEYYKDYTGPTDTLNLETTYSKFRAWNDTTSNILKGEALNKEGTIPVDIKWKEKIVYTDSLVYIDKPYPVEVPKEVKYIPGFCKFTIAWFILTLLYILINIYFKIRRNG